jgi:2-polyprenyl-3-methyl-5-hydroxy-6-metoxy-1,4-benzoquinol methylase
MRGIGLALRYINHFRIRAFGYVPERFRPADWDRLFETGAYDRMSSGPERARYSVIVGHCEVLRLHTILDVGCGQGVLAERLKRLDYERYVGLDISRTAIDEAQRDRPDPRNTYLTADATAFETEARFQLIVFNECLYYMEDPAAVVRHYLRFLEPGGRLIVSMYDTLRSSTVWPLLDTLAAEESTQIHSEGAASWTIKLMQPSGPHAS